MVFTALFDIPSIAAARTVELVVDTSASVPAFASMCACAFGDAASCAASDDAFDDGDDAACSEWGRHAIAWAGVNRVAVADATGWLHLMCATVDMI